MLFQLLFTLLQSFFCQLFQFIGFFGGLKCLVHHTSRIQTGSGCRICLLKLIHCDGFLVFAFGLNQRVRFFRGVGGGFGFFFGPITQSIRFLASLQCLGP
mmetsp:Transcript_29437/g.84616  ORF Transcript_29437/g.84616 Transcript_29437/m.84616 type:complete len:100 (-) Transcript_29437:500-799(-)